MKKRQLAIMLCICIGMTMLSINIFAVSDKSEIISNPRDNQVYFGNIRPGEPAVYRVVAKDADTMTLFYGVIDYINAGIYSINKFSVYPEPSISKIA